MTGINTTTQAVGLATANGSRKAGPEIKSTTSPSASVPKRLLVWPGRIALGALTFILSVNLWTGLPLLALWVGSQATGGELLNMTGVVAVVLALAILETASVIALTRISAGYDRLTGRPAPVRQPPPWLLSMSASKAQPAGRRE
jgi:hypothetical protein